MFSDLVSFRDEIATPELIMDGRINGINLEKFMKSILLSRPQLFEDMIYLENVFAASKRPILIFSLLIMVNM